MKLKLYFLPGPVEERRGSGIIGRAQASIVGDRHEAGDVERAFLHSLQGDCERIDLAARRDGDYLHVGRETAVAGNLKEQVAILPVGNAGGDCHLHAVADQRAARGADLECGVERPGGGGLNNGGRCRWDGRERG